MCYFVWESHTIMSNMSQKETLKLSKRAYLKGFLNLALQSEKQPEEAKQMAKQASEFRVKIASEDTQNIFRRRAEKLKKLFLERVA